MTKASKDSMPILTTIEADPIDDSESKDSPSLKYVKNVRDFGEVKPYWKFKGEEIMLHFDAAPKGGIKVQDKEGVIPQATKDLAKDIAGKLFKGKISDMSHMS